VTLEELRAGAVVAVDVNAGHLDAAVITADGNVAGTPFTVPLVILSFRVGRGCDLRRPVVDSVADGTLAA
jgi:hypothetical protein